MNADWVEAIVGGRALRARMLRGTRVKINQPRATAGEHRHGVPASWRIFRSIPITGPSSERIRAIIERLLAAERPSTRDVGREFGIGAAAVGQIARACGITAADLPRRPSPVKPRTCHLCGQNYEGAYRLHLDMSGHARSRRRRSRTEFLTQVESQPERTIAEIAASYGLKEEAAKRAVQQAGIFRRGRRRGILARDSRVIRRAKEGLSRRQLAEEFGLSLSHIFYILRIARSTNIGNETEVQASDR